MSTEPQPDPGLNWSTEPTATVPPGDATTERPAGTAAAGDTPTGDSAADASPLDGVIAKLPPNVAERPEALVGIAFGTGLVAALLLRAVGR